MSSAYHNRISKKSEGKARKRRVKPGSTKTSSPIEDKKTGDQGLQSFMDFINSKESMDGLAMYGA
jgi:hypothetical protein